MIVVRRRDSGKVHEVKDSETEVVTVCAVLVDDEFWDQPEPGSPEDVTCKVCLYDRRWLAAG